MSTWTLFVKIWTVSNCEFNANFFSFFWFILLAFGSRNYWSYRISANSFRGNYSFLNFTLCTVTFDHSTYRCGNYSREETIWGNTVSTIRRVPGTRANSSPEHRKFFVHKIILTSLKICIKIWKKSKWGWFGKYWASHLNLNTNVIDFLRWNGIA